MRRPAPTGCELHEDVRGSAAIRSWVDLPIALSGRHVNARIFTFRGLQEGREHITLGLGSFRRPLGGVPLVRVHSECLTGDVLGSRRCDCGPQLAEALELLDRHGGYLVYLRQEGRGIGLYAKVEAYRLQNQGMDTYEANRALGFREDARDYAAAALMLEALGVRRIDLLTGNPDKVTQLADRGIEIREIRRTGRHETPENVRYLATKQAVGHLFDPPED